MVMTIRKLGFYRLTAVCTPVLKHAFVREGWKVANVRLILKEGSGGDPGNYRLGSITSIPGKFIETMAKSRLVRHRVCWANVNMVL